MLQRNLELAARHRLWKSIEGSLLSPEWMTTCRHAQARCHRRGKEAGRRHPSW